MAVPTPDTAPDLVSRLLYRDSVILVLDKPAGMPVHPGPGGGPNLEALFDGLRLGLPRAPALAHRLDRDTSGCLVLGRHRKALARMGRLFSAGRVEKTYWAVARGEIAEDTGRIALKLAKKNAAWGWQMRVDPKGQPAVTEWRVRGRAQGLIWFELRPLTGRTHQIRVHLAALGCPVLGDTIYGAAETGAGFHLHARALSIPLYPERPPVAVEAPVPAHMAEALARLGWRADAADDVSASIADRR